MSVVPIADPTVLSTAQVDREIGHLKAIIDTRLEGMDRAVNLLEVAVERSPSLVDLAVGHLQSLHQQRFATVELQFVERDLRVDAAFAAAKEAVAEQNKANLAANAKMELSFTKQLDAINTLISTISNSSDGKIDDLKARVGLLEGGKKGSSDAWGFLVGIVGMIIALATVIVEFVGRR